MISKKLEEREVLELLLHFLNKNSSAPLIERESPDFLIQENGKNIGVEITKAYYKKNYIAENTECLKCDIKEILKQYKLYESNDDIFIKGDINKIITRKCYQIKLPPFVIDNLTKDIRKKISTAFDSWIKSGFPSDEMFTVFDTFSPKTTVELIFMVGSMPILDNNNKLCPISLGHPLNRIIEHKNELLIKNYIPNNPNIDEWWLCLETPWDSPIKACQYSLDGTYKNRFDKIFMIDKYRYRIYEIK